MYVGNIWTIHRVKNAAFSIFSSHMDGAYVLAWACACTAFTNIDFLKLYWIFSIQHISYSTLQNKAEAYNDS